MECQVGVTFYLDLSQFYVLCVFGFYGQKVRRKSRVCVGFYMVFSKLLEIPTKKKKKKMAHFLSILTATACSSDLALVSL